MHIRIAVALTALVGATGCWTDACEEYAEALDLATCRETLTWPYLDEQPGPYGWCHGSLSLATTCEELGYTATCLGLQVRPEDALRPTCR